MFPKKAANLTSKKCWVWSLWILLGAAAICAAQEPPATPAEQQDQGVGRTDSNLQTGQEPEKAKEKDTSQSDQSPEGYHTYDVLKTGQDQGEEKPPDENQPDAKEPIPVPVNAGTGEEKKTLGGQSLIDDVFQRVENRFGFSLSVYEAYTERLSGGSNKYPKSSAITAFMPRVFFNFGGHKSQYHIDLGSGYRHYNNSNELNSWDYYAATYYSYQISKRTSFVLSDQFISSYNDAWSFLSLYSPIYYDLSFSNEVIYDRQRITRNSLIAAYNYQFSSKGHFRVFGGYGAYLYPQNTEANTNGLEGGVSVDYRLKWKWLSLTNSYNAYEVRGKFRDSRIHDLQITGLNFSMGRSWRAWVGLGVGFTNTDKEFHTGESVNAGIGHTSLSCDFRITYSRGFSAAIGLSTVLMSDIVSARFGYRLTSRISSSLESSYYRSSELDYNGRLDTFSGGGGLQFALTQNLVASVNGSYQDQISHSFSVQGLDIRRYSAYVGLSYMWPSRRSARY